MHKYQDAFIYKVLQIIFSPNKIIRIYNNYTNNKLLSVSFLIFLIGIGDTYKSHELLYKQFFYLDFSSPKNMKIP